MSCLLGYFEDNFKLYNVFWVIHCEIIYILLTLKNNTKIQKAKKAKTSQTRFGPESDTGSAVSADPDLGLAKMDPRIRVRIWILFLKTDLDPGPPRPGPDPTCCHPYSLPVFSFPFLPFISFLF